MGNSQVMPKVDLDKDEKVRPETRMYTKYVESKNLERSITAKKLLRNKRITLVSSFVAVVAIYSYTILKIKQETFLDDFEEPPRVIKS